MAMKYSKVTRRVTFSLIDRSKINEKTVYLKYKNDVKDL